MLARAALSFSAKIRFYSISQLSSSACKPLKLHKSVKAALRDSKPVLALESTIITHGMPYPENLRTAWEAEAIAESYGVVPATIGVLNGVIHVGMSGDQLEELACAETSSKLSKRDLAVACSRSLTGGTTVSATMVIASWCGIDVFATGGIGGVHRMGQDTMDVSTDLRELGQTPVTVISSGVKSILDIQRTLEYLETEGVTVATLGKTNDFPAFFTKISGYKSPAKVETIEEAVKLIRTHQSLNLQSGVLLAVPIPDQYAACPQTINKAIQESLKYCRENKIEGSSVTPTMLEHINTLTGGKSLDANIGLIKNNVEVGAKVASGLREQTIRRSTKKKTHLSPVVIGGCNIDIVSKCLQAPEGKGPSNPAIITQSFGGVGHNIAETLWRLNSRPEMISAVGDDQYGDLMHDHLGSMGISSAMKVKNYRSGVYNAVFDNLGDVFVAVEDSAIHRQINKDFLKRHENLIVQAAMVCVDCNISIDGIEYVCELCQRHNKPLLFEPTGELIAAKAFLAAQKYPDAISYITPNIRELQEMYKTTAQVFHELGTDIETLKTMCKAILPYVSCVLVTMGGNGVLLGKKENGSFRFWHYTVEGKPECDWIKGPVVNVSGAGDGFAAGFAHGVLQGLTIDQSVRVGLTIAQRNLRSQSAVSKELSVNDVELGKNCWSAMEV